MSKTPQKSGNKFVSQRDPADVKRAEIQRAALRRALAGAKDMSYMQGASLGEIAGSPLACLPSSIPATRTRQVPMSPDEFDQDFGAEFSLIPDQVSQQNTGLISKLTTGGTPLAPFFLRAVCLLLRVDPAAWAMVGGAVARPAAAGTPPIRTPRVIPQTGLADDANAVPAVFEYNHQAIQGVTDLLLAYQFQYLLQGRFLMINERAMDVGMVDSHTCISGFGTAGADPGLIVGNANEHLGDTFGAGFPVFQWPNTTENGADGQPIEPPIVDNQYATPVAPGVFGMCYPVKPHVLFPGQNYQFLLTRVAESIYFDRLRERWTQNGTALQKADPNFADSRAADVNGPGIFGGYLPFRYSVLQYGTLLRGAEVLPEECMQWLLAFGQPYMSVISQPDVWAQVDALARSCGLNGVPTPLGLKSKDKRWEKTNAIEALYRLMGGSAGAEQNADGTLAGVDFNPSKIPPSQLKAILSELDAPMSQAAASSSAV